MSSQHTKAIFIPFFALFAGFFVVLCAFYKLQVLEHTKWYAIAKRQHTFEWIEQAPRGRIVCHAHPKHLAHKEWILAHDTPCYTLCCDPLRIPEHLHKPLATDLGKLLTNLLPHQEWDTHITKQLHYPTRYRTLVSTLPGLEQKKVANWWTHFARTHQLPPNALFFPRYYRRIHPYQHLCGQLIHTTRIEDPQAPAIPIGGLELALDEKLRGHFGKRLFLRTPHRTLATEKIVTSSMPGEDVVLTIDPVLQSLCERALKTGVEKAQARGGWASIIDPHTGQILALAQYPFFNPEEYQTVFSDPARQNSMLLHAAQSVFEPASSMKPLGLLLALEAREHNPTLFDPQEPLTISSGFLPGRQQPLTDTKPMRKADMDIALNASSNIYMAKVADRIVTGMGKQWYYEKLSALGFGSATRLPLPFEEEGFLPQPQGRYTSGRPTWSRTTTQSLSIGYNLQVTALQLARAYCVIANGGELPTLTITKNTPIHRVRVVAAHNAKRILHALRFVGEKRTTKVWGYTTAGKTGTTRKIIGGRYSTTKYCANFHGIAPAADPKLVISVVIDEPSTRYVPGVGHLYYGNQSAAPIFQRIAQDALAYLGVVPDDPAGYRIDDPRTHLTQSVWSQHTKEQNQRQKQMNATASTP